MIKKQEHLVLINKLLHHLFIQFLNFYSQGRHSILFQDQPITV